MGKLVLYLADGTLLHVPLDKERITIGRRADNDVCLPYPAVSGEHAAVVTILADSFLEDMGSTNGTLVNGKTAGKHFLNDHDQIDIGRQRLTYLADNDARVDPLPPDMVRNQMRGLSERVAPVHGALPMPMPSVNMGYSASASRGIPHADDFVRETALPPRDVAAPSGRAFGAPVATPNAPARQGGAVVTDHLGMPIVARVAPPPPREPTPPRAPFTGDVPSWQAGVAVDPDALSRTLPLSARAVASVPTPVVPEPLLVPDVPAPKVPSVRVLSGPSTGRSVPFPNDQLSVGRVGIQVAIVRKLADGYRLIPVEGDDPPRINGAPVPADGARLHPGDTFEVAGVRLELAVGS